MKPPFNKMLATLLGLVSLTVSQAAEIHDAAKAGDVAHLNALLATNHDLVDLTAQDELTPLHLAAREGKLNTVQSLVERGARVNAADVHGCTPLHSAVYGKHLSVAEYLLDHGAKVDAARTEGTTPLYYAAGHGDTNLVNLLLQRGAKPDAPAASGYFPLLAATHDRHKNVIEMLAAAGAKLDAKDQNGHTALHVAASVGSGEIVEWLLDHGADANAEDRSSWRAVDYVRGVTNDALILMLAQHMTPPANQSAPVKVGEIGDPDRVLFEGVESFTNDQLRRALATKPGYLLASHPQANLKAFLEELQRILLSGYQSVGFPDAQVAVRFDSNLLRARVKVVEGPRFKAGKVRVVGDRSSSGRELVRWLTTSAENSKSAARSDNKDSGLNTPGKAERSDDPIWVPGDPVDFSGVWATQAVAQVEACLAEQGFFFPEAQVEIQRALATGTADLLITIKSEGPPGIIGQIKVSGQQQPASDDIIRFLKLRKGAKISADRLVAARRKLRDCGRFLNFEITPEYPGSDDQVASRHVNLHIVVEEMEGVPGLNEPLTPTQQALVRLCEWLERFPTRDEEISLTVRGPIDLPVAVEFALSPRRGLLLNANLEGIAPVSAGFLLADDSVQLCAWASGNKLAATRAGSGTFFLHLLPNEKGSSNRFNLSVGGGYRGTKASSLPPQRPLLSFDIQLSRAAFLEMATRTNAGAYLSGGTLIVTNEGFLLRADAKTGRLVEMSRPNDQPAMKLQFGGRVWNHMRGDFTRHSANLTNTYSQGHGFSSFLALATGEVARFYLLQGASTNADQRRLASAAVRKLVSPEVLAPVDWIFLTPDTNAFSIPMDGMESAMAMNSIATLLSGFAFGWSDKMFPKHSWPWTAARESAFVMMSQGRYTDLELERLYGSDETGPIGFLAIAHLLKLADSPATKDFALQGLTRLGAENFLADCHLFLRGDSGLARSFAKLVEAVRALPEDELAALIAVFPESEADLLRDSATALRTQPEATPESVLSPALARYWQESLRPKVRAALYQLTTRSAGPSGRTAALPPAEHDREPGI